MDLSVLRFDGGSRHNREVPSMQVEGNSLQCLEIASVMSFSCYFLMRNPESVQQSSGDQAEGKRAGKGGNSSCFSPELGSDESLECHGKWFSKDHGIFSPSLGLVPWTPPGFLNLVSVLLRGGNGISKFHPFSKACEMSAGREL